MIYRHRDDYRPPCDRDAGRGLWRIPFVLAIALLLYALITRMIDMWKQ